MKLKSEGKNGVAKDNGDGLIPFCSYHANEVSNKQIIYVSNGTSCSVELDSYLGLWYALRSGSDQNLFSPNFIRYYQ